MEQPLHHPPVEGHKEHGRQLHGIWLWLARALYFSLFALVLTFFVAGIPSSMDVWNQGGIGVSISLNAKNQLILSVPPTSDAAEAGIRNGDVLIAIDGITPNGVAQAKQMITGKVGSPINLTVQTDNAAPRQYSLVFSGGFLHLLAQMHLSLQFLVTYNTALSSLITLAVIVASPLVFLRRSKDWLVILVAFSMIAFASYSMTPVGYGAYQLHAMSLINWIYALGMASMVVVFLIFPSGHFEPRWTRWLAIFLFVPAVLDFLSLQFIYNFRTVALLNFCLWFIFFALGAFSQGYRYQRVSTPAERQQTKQVVFGGVACLLITALLDLATSLLASRLTGAQLILLYLIIKAGTTLPVLVLDWSFVFAIYHYHLWDTDLYISRTLVYTLVTLFLVTVWALITRVLNYAFQQLLGKQVGWLSALLSSLPVAAAYKPIRGWVEKWVNTHFYKDRIDYSEALVELKPEMWNFLTPADLGHTLVTIIPALLQSASGALFLQSGKTMKLTEVHNIHPSDAAKFHFSEDSMKKLANGNIVSLHEQPPFAMLVPLTVSRFKITDLIGVLAVGPRIQGRGYSRDHLTDLATLGRNAGMALHMLKLNEKKQAKEIPTATEG